MTGGEGGYEDIGLGAFDRIVIHTGVHGFQNVVGAQSQSTDVEGSIRQQAEQESWIFHSNGGGLVVPFAKFVPETAITKERMRRGGVTTRKKNMDKVPFEH